MAGYCTMNKDGIQLHSEPHVAHIPLTLLVVPRRTCPRHTPPLHPHSCHASATNGVSVHTWSISFTTHTGLNYTRFLVIFHICHGQCRYFISITSVLKRNSSFDWLLNLGHSLTIKTTNLPIYKSSNLPALRPTDSVSVPSPSAKHNSLSYKKNYLSHFSLCLPYAANWLEIPLTCPRARILWIDQTHSTG